MLLEIVCSVIVKVQSRFAIESTTQMKRNYTWNKITTTAAATEKREKKRSEKQEPYNAHSWCMKSGMIAAVAVAAVITAKCD